MGTVSKVLVPVTANLEVGTYTAGSGVSSWTNVGYTQEGFEITNEVETNDVEVAEEVKALDRYITKETVSLTVTLAETDVTVLSMCLPGVTVEGGTISFGGGVLQKVGLRLTWTDTNGGSHVHTIVRATPSGTATRKINRKTGLVGYQITFIDLAPENPSSPSNEVHPVS